MAETTIEREIEIVEEGFKKLQAESKGVTNELKQVNAGLRIDPKNVELTAEKFEIMGRQAESTKSQTEALQHQIDLMTQAIAEGSDKSELYAERIKTLEAQKRGLEIQTTALTGAIENQTKAQEQGALSTQSFSKSMTEFNSMLGLVSRSTKGLSTLYEMLDTRTAENKKQQDDLKRSMEDLNIKYKEGAITQEQYKNSSLAIEKQLLATKRAGEDLENNVFRKMLGTLPKIIQVTQGLAAAMKLAAIATGAWKSALTLGVAAAAIVAGIVAIERATNKATASVGDTSSVSSGISSSSISTPSISTPSVPRISGGTSSGGVVVQTLSELQIENAVHKSVTRVLVELGINSPQFTGRMEINGREFARATFNDILSENQVRGNPLGV